MLLAIALTLLTQTGTCKEGAVCRASALQTPCVPTASLPLCQASVKGQIRCDLTKNCEVFCNGAAWACTGDYATTDNLVYFVDTGGNDTHNCLAAGAANACLTIQGALNKSPRMLRHQVTVNVAAGNYAGFKISGFTVDPGFQTATAGILIDGALVNAAVATGTNTGTATGGTAGSSTTFGTLVDAAQGWTVNNLRGKLIVITAGLGINQSRMISANTATSLTIAGVWTATDATSVYAIRTPSVIITSTTPLIPTALAGTALAAAGIQIADNNAQLQSIITIRNMAVTTTPAMNVIGGQSILMIQDVLSGGTSTVSQTGTDTFTLTNSAILNAGGTALTSTQAVLNINQSFIQCSATCLTVASAGRVAALSNQFVSSAAAAVPISLTTGSTGAITSNRCDCGSGATSACLSIGSGNAPTTPSQYATANVVLGLDVTNCAYGVAAQNGSVAFSPTATFTGNALTYSAMSSNGGSIILPSAITITSGTADLSVDNGAKTSAFAALTAIYDCIAAATTGSKVCRL